MKIRIAMNKTDGDYILTKNRSGIPRRFYFFDKEPCSKQEVLLSSLDNSADKLLELPNLGDILRDEDPDVDLEKTGKFLQKKTRIVVDGEKNPVYNYKMVDIVTRPDGTAAERPHETQRANIDTDVPLMLVDRYYKPEELVTQFLFRRHYLIQHYNGLSFNFLREIAQDLAKRGKFQQVKAVDPETKKAVPIRVTTGGVAYSRAFLEGRVRNDEYCLILHLSDREFKWESDRSKPLSNQDVQSEEAE